MKTDNYAEQGKSYNDTSLIGTNLSCEDAAIRITGTTQR